MEWLRLRGEWPDDEVEVGAWSAFQEWKRDQSFPAIAYAVSSFLVVLLAAIPFIYFGLVGGLMYFWVFFPLKWALEFVQYMVHGGFIRLRRRGPMLADPILDPDEVRIVALLRCSPAESRDEFRRNDRIFCITGSPEKGWDHYFRFLIIVLILMPFMTALGVKMVITIDAANSRDLVEKVMRGAFWGPLFDVFLAAFWERRVDRYWKALRVALRRTLPVELNHFL